MRHTATHSVDILPYVQIIDVPVPQMGNQVVEVLQFVDSLVPVAEQVIDVPKIFPEEIPSRLSCRELQLAEQLVDVPTNPGYSLASKAFSRRELRGVLSGQGSTASGAEIYEQNVFKTEFNSVGCGAERRRSSSPWSSWLTEVFKIYSLDRFQ